MLSGGRKRILSPFAGRKKRKAWSKTREKYMPEEKDEIQLVLLKSQA